MTAAALDHPMGRILQEAGAGRFPPAGRQFQVGPVLSGPCDAALFFQLHTVVAAPVSEAWVAEHLADHLDRPPSDPSTGLAAFVGALGRELGSPPVYASFLTVADYRPAFVRGTAEPGGEVNPSWAAYRTEVRSYRYRGASVRGVFAYGRGPGGRWDVYLHDEEHVGPAGNASRELLTAARTMVPDKGLVFGSAPLHDTRVLRALLGSGFTPICTEALYLTRPAV